MRNQMTKCEPKPLSLSTFLINPYGKHVYRFDVGVPIDELIDTLKADKADILSVDMLFRRKPFFGTISGDTFVLTWLQSNIKNSWAPVAVGKMADNGDRSRLDVSFRLHLFVRVFVWIWIIAASAIAATLSFSRGSQDASIYLTAGLPLFGILLALIGSFVGRWEQGNFLRYFWSLPETNYIDQSRVIE